MADSLTPRVAEEEWKAPPLAATDARSQQTIPQSYVTGLEDALESSGGDGDGDLEDHIAETTTAHGGIVADTDPRLTDDRDPNAHVHAQADVTNLVTDLAGKAASSHSHAQADVTNLVSDLAGKAATSHSHAQSDVTNLVSDLAGKAATSHTHVLADITNGWQTVVLGGDVATSATSYADVTGLSFAVVSGTRYQFEVFIVFDVNATTTGHQFAMNGPTLTQFGYTKRSPLTGATEDIKSRAMAYDSGATTTTTNEVAGNICTIVGFIQPSANGTLIVRFLSEVVSPGTVTVKRGSYLRYLAV